REHGWRHKLVVNLAAGILSTIVVGIFVVAKFTEGAWLVVVVFPILVYALIRLNRQYRAEASVLEMSRTERPDLAEYDRVRVFVFVDSVDLAEIEALRYGKELDRDELLAVHFVVDADHSAQLQERWQHFEHDTQLRVIDCPDRNLSRVAQELVLQVKRDHPDTKVTVLLPRRTYSALLGRLLHDRTADKMGRAVSRIPGATAIIVPYDIESRIARVAPDALAARVARETDEVESKTFPSSDPPEAHPRLNDGHDGERV
ncbi:MAG: DNA-binding protein, partial [Mycobacterium sp.]